MPSPMSGSQPAASPTRSACGAAIGAPGTKVRIGNACQRVAPRADVGERGRQLALQLRARRWRQRVDADVHVRRAVDPARERPAVAAHAARDGPEIEIVAPAHVSIPCRAGRRDVAHDRATDHARVVVTSARRTRLPPPSAPTTTGAQNARVLGLDAYPRPSRTTARTRLSSRSVHATIARREGQARVQLAPADDTAEIVARDRERAPGNRHRRGVDAGLRDVERNAQRGQQRARLRDHPARARLVARVARLVEQQRARGQRRRALRDAQRRRRSRRSRTDDDDLPPLHLHAL